MQQQTKQTYEFGPFRLNPVKRVLLRDGEPVPLTPKALDTLLALVEANGQLLEKDELMQRVWPDSFVEEGNLTVYISTLRKALGENRGEHCYIVTVPGRGYRFVADVREVWGDGSELMVEEHAQARILISEEEQTASKEFLPSSLLIKRLISRTLQALQTRWKVLAFAGVLIGLALIGAFWLRSPKSNRAVNPTELRHIQLANWKSPAGEIYSDATFSRDGNLIAYSLVKGHHRNLWLQQLIGDEAIQVTREEADDWNPIWSPDSQQIAFVSRRGNQVGIWRMPSHGGSPSLILRVETAMRPQLKRWSNDGTRIYYESNFSLFAVDNGSGQATQLVHFDPAEHPAMFFSLSPEENLLAYVDIQNGQSDVWVKPLSGGDPIRITNDSESEYKPVWHPDGKRILYSSKREGIEQIFVAYLDNTQSMQITSEDDDVRVLDVSSDGTKILYGTIRQEADIWKTHIDTGEAAEVTSDLGIELGPDVSPDGNKVAFHIYPKRSRANDPQGSFIVTKSMQADGQQVTQAAHGVDVKWSPDGKTLGFLRRQSNVTNLWIVSAIGGDEKQLTTQVVYTVGYVYFPFNRLQTTNYSWSPDSSKIAYASKNSGEVAIWLVSTDGSGERKLLSQTGAPVVFHCPLWSPDGKHLACVSQLVVKSGEGKQLWKLWVVNVETGEAVEIFQSEFILRLLGWTASGTDLLLATINDLFDVSMSVAEVNIVRVPATGSASSIIAQIPAAYFNNIYLSPRGRFIATVSRQDNSDNLWIVPTIGGEAMKVSENTDPRIYFSSLAWSPNEKEIFFGKQTKWCLISMIDNLK